jgi:hypothetical protein
VEQYDAHENLQGYSTFDLEEQANAILGGKIIERPINTFGDGDTRTNGTRVYNPEVQFNPEQRDFQLVAYARTPPKNILGKLTYRSESPPMEPVLCFTCGEEMEPHPTRVDCDMCHRLFIAEQIMEEWE